MHQQIKELGRRKSDGFGTFTFDNVSLREGENTITANSSGKGPKAADTVVWTLIK
ncbi:hypothetical protein [Muribaculum intestinale]|uniref:hypothetical protein n=1 Tax=Muribaculum intestinale TaxID=1796646 RepID=UPI0012FA8C00|nr:hypothetical protein [Muribaculum intestinale]MYM12859.1 hypothetical protein [Muribaculum intestinale]QQR10155.1 hypothetical protein I5Q90_06585 [Muribaculum intestinale]